MNILEALAFSIFSLCLHIWISLEQERMKESSVLLLECVYQSLMLCFQYLKRYYYNMSKQETLVVYELYEGGEQDILELQKRSFSLSYSFSKPILPVILQDISLPLQKALLLSGQKHSFHFSQKLLVVPFLCQRDKLVPQKNFFLSSPK